MGCLQTPPRCRRRWPGSASLGASSSLIRVRHTCLTLCSLTPATLLSLLYYPFEALVASEFDGLVFSLTIPGQVSMVQIPGSGIVAALSESSTRIGSNLVCLLLLLVMLNSAACLALSVRAAPSGTFDMLWGRGQRHQP